MNFQLESEYKPSGDQPEAITKLVKGVENGDESQILLGVTGSGKTFTIANVIQETGRPTLVLSHNKTLAAQLYGEFKTFFPNNAVEYFVSYYDYYQPEAYLPVTATYIEKDLSINEEIEKLRLRATSALLSGRRDVIVVSSVSCLYGIGNPNDFEANTIRIEKGQTISRNKLLHSLVASLYSRTEAEFKPGTFRVKGDTVDIYPAYADNAYRILFWDNEIDELSHINPVDGTVIEKAEELTVFPATLFVTSPDRLHQSIRMIQDDLMIQYEKFMEDGMREEANRLKQRTEFDLEMMKELGYCSGIENYSRYFDGRPPGSRPFCLLDYFPKDFLTVIDESHVTIPQIRAMYGGDFSRKTNLVSYGFRLPAALDNRPLTFDEFTQLRKQIIYVSATPADYELEETGGEIVEQIIRPTGLIDPPISVRPSLNQIDDLLNEIHLRIQKNERVLVTTLTKRMAEELNTYFANIGLKCRYVHSDVDTLERVEIMEQLREGIIDVLIGVNLLREGLDLPEVSLVAILDADKEGFLRNTRSLTQTAGRAARNLNGQVIMYADKITKSMQETIDNTEYRRTKQIKYNEKHNITPTQIKKAQKKIIESQTDVQATAQMVAEPEANYESKAGLERAIEQTKKAMQKASKDLDFIYAAQLRDKMYAMQEKLKNM
ncbi:excinuclease ABC subunit B [Balneicella halophila]|uniref:UvrABC system protein B n=1 Tax=Balneicella halophila TaxID=1537566 RepID=A0A7L4US84_BALHA|nr:excinuclease ABC subunit UvrB [Balneicella halophila]PVX52332.1 excinuclease ABC subunit B [Balneicella halophila]